MKRNIALILTIAALTLAGCGYVDDGDGKAAATEENGIFSTSPDSEPDVIETTQPEPEPEPEPQPDSVPDEELSIPTEELSPDTIVVISRYSNWAWGYQDNGRFVTLDGRMYEFNFGYTDDPDEQKEPPEDFMKALEDIRDTAEPVGQADSGVIARCLDYASKIDPESEYAKEETACDAGQHSVYSVWEGEMTELYTYGDNTGGLCDPSADAILDLLDESGIMNSGRNNEFSGSAGGGLMDFFDNIFG